MKKQLLTGASLLALIVTASTARATVISYTGGVVDYTVPTTGTYDIVAAGAQGGSGVTNQSLPAVSSGLLGGQAGGVFSLSAGTVLEIAVGGTGVSASGNYAGGGGGGGSFVVQQSGTVPLVVVGGGGGAGLGGHGYSGGTGSSGTNGSGGASGNQGEGGGGGGGFKGSGTVGSHLNVGGSGISFAGGLAGGLGQITGSLSANHGGNGGFGGGGGGSYGGGGGGGYNGGGGGFCVSGFCTDGGGRNGGNYINIRGTSLGSRYGVQSGNGYVSITEITSAPEPASATLFGVALAGLGLVRRRFRGQKS